MSAKHTVLFKSAGLLSVLIWLFLKNFVRIGKRIRRITWLYSWKIKRIRRFMIECCDCYVIWLPNIIPKTLLQIRCLLKCHQLYNLYICSPYLSLTKCILYHLNYVLGKTPRIRNQLSVCQQLMLQLSTQSPSLVILLTPLDYLPNPSLPLVLAIWKYRSIIH
mgnify:CR=1 FL=1